MTNNERQIRRQVVVDNITKLKEERLKIIELGADAQMSKEDAAVAAATIASEIGYHESLLEFGLEECIDIQSASLSAT